VLSPSNLLHSSFLPTSLPPPFTFPRFPGYPLPVPPLLPLPPPSPISPFCANRAEITVRFNSKERLYITVFTREGDVSTLLNRILSKREGKPEVEMSCYCGSRIDIRGSAVDLPGWLLIARFNPDRGVLALPPTA